MTPLNHLVYVSQADQDFKEHQIPSLLERARTNNGILGLTGMLLYIEGTFFQVLEGESAVLDTLYTTILGDNRHTQVTQIIREPIAERNFGEWTMGFSVVDRLDAGQLLGENDYFNSASCIARMNGGRAKKLLAAFRSGRWRMKRTDADQTVGRVA
jgi:hypothetical protein